MGLGKMSMDPRGAFAFFLAAVLVGCASGPGGVNLHPEPGSNTPYHILLVEQIYSKEQAEALVRLLEKFDQRAILILDFEGFEDEELIKKLNQRVDLYLRSPEDHEVTEGEWGVLSTKTVPFGVCVRGVWLYPGSKKPKLSGAHPRCGGRQFAVQETYPDKFSTLMAYDKAPKAPDRIFPAIFDPDDRDSVFAMKTFRLPGGAATPAARIDVLTLRFKRIHEGHGNILADWLRDRQSSRSTFLPVEYFTDMPWK